MSGHRTELGGPSPLTAVGYRAPAGEGHHYVVLQSLAFTVSFDEGAVRKLNTLRKKRHNATYGHPGAVSDGEASTRYV